VWEGHEGGEKKILQALLTTAEIVIKSFELVVR